MTLGRCQCQFKNIIPFQKVINATLQPLLGEYSYHQKRMDWLHFLPISSSNSPLEKSKATTEEDVLTVARLAGILAVKSKHSSLIPLCHPPCSFKVDSRSPFGCNGTVSLRHGIVCTATVTCDVCRDGDRTYHRRDHGFKQAAEVTTFL